MQHVHVTSRKISLLPRVAMKLPALLLLSFSSSSVCFPVRPPVKRCNIKISMSKSTQLPWERPWEYASKQPIIPVENFDIQDLLLQQSIMKYVDNEITSKEISASASSKDSSNRDSFDLPSFLDHAHLDGLWFSIIGMRTHFNGEAGTF